MTQGRWHMQRRGENTDAEAGSETRVLIAPLWTDVQEPWEVGEDKRPGLWALNPLDPQEVDAVQLATVHP